MATGAGSIDVNTFAVSGWDASVPGSNDWIVLTGGAEYAAGPRTLSYAVNANASGIRRTGQIRVASTYVTVTQEGDGDTTAPAITWSNPAAIVYGTPLGATQLNATANVAGTFA